MPDVGIYDYTEGNETVRVEVYELEPAGNQLCVWMDELPGDWCLLGSTDFWSTDEWLGHVPVVCLKGEFSDV